MRETTWYVLHVDAANEEEARALGSSGEVDPTDSESEPLEVVTVEAFDEEEL
jgi:hypothetical protein